MANTKQPRPMVNSTNPLLQEVVLSFGINAKEAAVYLAALESGARSVQAIAAAAKTERTGTYDVLERLASRGLVRLERVGKRTSVVLEPPQAVRETLNAQLSAVDAVLPRLETLYNQTVDNFSAERGVGPRVFTLLQSSIASSTGPVRILLGSVSPADIEDPQRILDSLTPLLAYRKTKLLVAASLTAATASWLTQLQAIIPSRRLPSPIVIQTSRVIAEDRTLTIGSESDDVVGVVITSLSNAQHESAIFNVLWRSGKPFFAH